MSSLPLSCAKSVPHGDPLRRHPRDIAAGVPSPRHRRQLAQHAIVSTLMSTTVRDGTL
jgi:hypothetical protein